MKELEWLKTTIKTETAHLEQDAYIELLRELAAWAENEAGLLEFSMPDTDDYDE
jgi:hypothetical protein|nr:MAG TPA_asm: hypothetical protein [Caudoviricetes sp.]